ncbi:hypothetical protein EVA_02037 [gut metagenome]|uniref:Uncharacterized protein n=1 Tax=gut metagenome TaxID=749906 RepID=J9H211_9ZZZZ
MAQCRHSAICSFTSLTGCSWMGTRIFTPLPLGLTKQSIGCRWTSRKISSRSCRASASDSRWSMSSTMAWLDSRKQSLRRWLQVPKGVK